MPVVMEGLLKNVLILVKLVTLCFWVIKQNKIPISLHCLTEIPRIVICLIYAHCLGSAFFGMFLHSN